MPLIDTYKDPEKDLAQSKSAPTGVQPSPSCPTVCRRSYPGHSLIADSEEMALFSLIFEAVVADQMVQ